MPEIEIQHVVSCSSADKNNPAENLLKTDGAHKWKSASPGEKSISCVLQLSKSSQIHSIDIGNEGSAFVEVLVGKATAASDQDFEVLLVASAFMSPLESRNGTNKNAVRMFSSDKLNSVTASQKWDRVKVVCTQPFSKLFQYGLSFIKLHSPPGEDNGEMKVKKFGAFAVKETEEDAGDDIKVGSLFASRSHKDASPAPSPTGRPITKFMYTGSAETSAASAAAEPSTSTRTPSSKNVAPSSKNFAPSSKTVDPSSSKVTTKGNTASKDDKDAEEDEEGDVPVKTPLKRKSTSLSSVSSSSSTAMGDKSALKRTKTEPATPSAAKSFTQLMDGVVFVLSGFQNPYRSQLRDQALEMGAKYRPDWGRDCTHLVCAFPNTPKYQQVAGKGKIVTKAWIVDCYKQKKLLSWRHYRLGDADSPDESSDNEQVMSQPKRQDRKETPQSSQTTSTSSPRPSKTPNKKAVIHDDSDSGGDTDDELRKIREKDEREKATEKISTPKEETDPYGNSTDEDNPPLPDTVPMNDASNDNGSDSGLPDLPDFFTDKHFFFYGHFEPAEQRLLTRYIAAYNGEVEEYMSKKVTFVVTEQKWDDNFNQAASENPQLIFVKPTWIKSCHDKNKLLPYQPHIVVP
ncbi:hypothetical protein BsWGS_03157 [Bradybaena similaris]